MALRQYGTSCFALQFSSHFSSTEELDDKEELEEEEEELEELEELEEEEEELELEEGNLATAACAVKGSVQPTGSDQVLSPDCWCCQYTQPCVLLNCLVH